MKSLRIETIMSDGRKIAALVAVPEGFVVTEVVMHPLAGAKPPIASATFGAEGQADRVLPIPPGAWREVAAPAQRTYRDSSGWTGTARRKKTNLEDG